MALCMLTRPGHPGSTGVPVPKHGRRRTRHLGALDDWGMGVLEALDDGGGRGSYAVTATHVTVAAGLRKWVDGGTATGLRHFLVVTGT